MVRLVRASSQLGYDFILRQSYKPGAAQRDIIGGELIERIRDGNFGRARTSRLTNDYISLAGAQPRNEVR